MIEYKCRRCEHHFCSENGMPYCPACDCESLEEIFNPEIKVNNKKTYFSNCEKCDKRLESCLIEEHHKHPRFMDNKAGAGMKINLCRGCHMKLHLIVSSIIWNNIHKNKQQVIMEVVDYTTRWLKK